MTQFPRVPLIVVIVMFGFVLGACGLQSAQTAPATRTPYVITAIVTMTPSATETPTRSAAPAAYSTETAYPTPIPFVLSDSNPKDTDLVRLALSQHLPSELVEIEVRQVGNGTHNRFVRQEADVNDDGQAEIVVTDEIPELRSAYLAILGLENTSGARNQPLWRELFYLEAPGHYCWNMRGTINHNRVIADSLTCGGGPGLFAYDWKQHWIHCTRDGCHEVWSAHLLDAYGGYASTSSHRFSVGRVIQSDSDTIQFITQRFEMRWVPNEDSSIMGTQRIVGPDTSETYRWNGQVYDLVQREQIAPGIEITREFDLETAATEQLIIDTLIEPFRISIFGGTSYDWAKVDVARSAFWGVPSPNIDDPIWPSRYYMPSAAGTDRKKQKVAGVIAAKDRPLCRLTVQRYVSQSFELIGRKDVPCTPQFTRLFWIDLDDDGDDELLLLTIPPNSLNTAYEISARQRLHLYRASMSLNELTAIDGAINDGDGVGIKWENTEDGFRLFTGLPLAKDDNCGRSFACVTLERHFQTYRWDKAINSFSLVK